MQTYDSGVASVFQVPAENAGSVSINYVGVLQDILKLDYDPLHTPVILLQCEWMKRPNNSSNLTYTCDEAGFLLVNFRHKLPQMSEPFIFASQATQVLFFKCIQKAKVEGGFAKRVDIADAFISTTRQSTRLSAPNVVPGPRNTTSLVGAIELSSEETPLATAGY
jgi:hypothetical protein